MAELALPAGLNASTFPAKLWKLVNSPHVRSLRWDSRGQGLLIDRSLLERELLSPGGALAAGGEGAGPAPDSFQATHFGSFVRQLNLYGFHKVPAEAGGWLHFTNANFRRDRPDLLLHIKRLTRANRQRLAAGLEVRSRQPSRFQQLRTERPLPAFSAGQPPRAGETGWELREPRCRGLWPWAVPGGAGAGPGRAGAAQRSCPGRHRGCPWARQLCRQGPGAVPALPGAAGQSRPLALQLAQPRALAAAAPGPALGCLGSSPGVRVSRGLGRGQPSGRSLLVLWGRGDRAGSWVSGSCLLPRNGSRTAFPDSSANRAGLSRQGTGC